MSEVKPTAQLLEEIGARLAIQDAAKRGDFGEDAIYLERAAQWIEEIDNALAERLRAMYRRTP